jgi:hypothetical protein
MFSKVCQNKLDRQIEIDVHSRFSETDLEYVNVNDAFETVDSFDSWHEFDNERKFYD